MRQQPSDDDAAADDDGFGCPPWWNLGQTLSDVDPETWSGTGWAVALSPDGLTLANAYPLMDRHLQMVGFKTLTYTYVARLKNWIPLDDPILVDAPSAAVSTGTLEISMTDNLLALSHNSFDYEGTSIGEVRVWYLSETMGRGRVDVYWTPIGGPIENNSKQQEKEQFGYSVSISEAGNDNRYLVAVGIPALLDPSELSGRVEVYTFLPPEDPFKGEGHWGLFGNPIVGNNGIFGSSVEFSADGTVLAILGSVTVEDDTDRKSVV